MGGLTLFVGTKEQNRRLVRSALGGRDTIGFHPKGSPTYLATPDPGVILHELAHTFNKTWPGHDRGMMAWWRPAQTRHLYFHKSTNIPSGPAPVPAMLFMVQRRGLSVWALDVKERPEPKTRLYHAPFFNTMRDGVCLGNMRLPSTATPADIEKWERTYWRSAFTLDGPPFLKGISGVKLWQQLVGSGRKSFPVKHLRPYGRTVKQILEDA